MWRVGEAIKHRASGILPLAAVGAAVGAMLGAAYEEIYQNVERLGLAATLLGSKLGMLGIDWTQMGEGVLVGAAIGAVGIPVANAIFGNPISNPSPRRKPRF